MTKQKTVFLKNGSYRGQVIDGEYNLVHGWKVSARAGDKDGVVRVMLNGKAVNVCIDEIDVTYEAPAEESYEEILARITKRFNILERMTSGVIEGVIKALIVAGAPGVGKTFTVERMLKAAALDGLIEFEHVKGRMSAVGLYRMLFKCSEPGGVLVIDDCDGIFSDEDALNLLKGALDTSDERWISWNTDASFLEKDGIPQKFNFQGTVIFISNLNFQSVIEADGRMAPHMDALISRSIYLDLALHDQKAIMARVEDLSLNTPMLFKKGLSVEQVKTTLEWLRENLGQLNERLSLRTALKLAQFVATDDDWEEIAEVALLKIA